MKVFMIGLPGCGKTTLGKEIASLLKLPFIDLDVEIEKRHGASIREIFKQKGEDFFRTEESAQLKEWCRSEKSFVMATGGGAPVFFDNLDVINHCGKSIFLDVPAKEIARRILNTPLAERPLLAKATPDSLKDQIEFMRSQRLPFYKRAHFTLTGNAITASEIFTELRKGNLQ